MRSVLIDTGPLVAMLDAGDVNHRWAMAQMERVSGIAATVWPAITEASHILSRRAPATRRLMTVLAENGLDIVAQTRKDYSAMAELAGQYEDLPMDLADASLVHAYHTGGFDAIMTTDIRDFSIYRIKGRPLNLITPRS